MVQTWSRSSRKMLKPQGGPGSWLKKRATATKAKAWERGRGGGWGGDTKRQVQWRGPPRRGRRESLLPRPARRAGGTLQAEGPFGDVCSKRAGRGWLWLPTGQAAGPPQVAGCFPSPPTAQDYLGHGGPPLGPAVQAAAGQLTQGQAQLRGARPRPGVHVLLVDLGGDRGRPGVFGQAGLERGLGASQDHPGLLGFVINQVFLRDGGQ